ncbi:Putative transposase [Burkholderiales bacterium JOSHI_001]|nr:Putative transposase [Burkholderiales bacterium JOSHI_001]
MAPRSAASGIDRSSPSCTGWRSNTRPASSPTAKRAQAVKCLGSSRTVRRLPRVRHPRPRFPEAALRRVRARLAAGLQLQAAGNCPSRDARRMSQATVHLEEHFIPPMPVRQWVRSLPIPLCLLLAAQPELVTPVLQVVRRVVTHHPLDRGGLKADEGQGGAVTLIQRFGSAANLNIRLHCLVLGSVNRCDADGAPAFVEADAPNDDESHALLQTLINRLMKLLTRRCVLVEVAGQPLCADIDGFKLYAAVRVEAHDRKRLEQLCRCITRPTLSGERVQPNAVEPVEFKLKTPWRDGTKHLVMSPLEGRQRLAALVPRPWAVPQELAWIAQSTEPTAAAQGPGARGGKRRCRLSRFRRQSDTPQAAERSRSRCGAAPRVHAACLTGGPTLRFEIQARQACDIWPRNTSHTMCSWPAYSTAKAHRRPLIDRRLQSRGSLCAARVAPAASSAPCHFGAQRRLGRGFQGTEQVGQMLLDQLGRVRRGAVRWRGPEHGVGHCNPRGPRPPRV